VKDPVRYATEAFRQALRFAHIELQEPQEDAKAPEQGSGAEKEAPTSEGKRRMLAEHISPPFGEEVKLTLKVSQNLHAATTPYLLGAILNHASDDAFLKGMALERRFLADAGLDPQEVSQLDGEGGMGSAFSPDFMVRYLSYMARQSVAKTFFNALPVLGRDGTLAEMLQDSPAAGHVHAKTGSYVVANSLTGGVMLLGKGLAGYIDARNGHRLVFAAYVNMVPLRDMSQVAEVGQMLTEMAAAAYQQAAAEPQGAGTAAEIPRNRDRKGRGVTTGR
jgi:D-alanyl-D-alanine carboxypeptidase